LWSLCAFLGQSQTSSIHDNLSAAGQRPALLWRAGRRGKLWALFGWV